MDATFVLPSVQNCVPVRTEQLLLSFGLLYTKLVDKEQLSRPVLKCAGGSSRLQCDTISSAPPKPEEKASRQSTSNLLDAECGYYSKLANLTVLGIASDSA